MLFKLDFEMSLDLILLGVNISDARMEEGFFILEIWLVMLIRGLYSNV